MTDIADLQKQIDGLKANYDESLDTIWMLLAGMLVFFMHAGFSLLEVGTVRFKNAQNILTKNLLVVCLGFLCWYVFGWTLAYGAIEDPHKFSGGTEFFMDGFWDDKTKFRNWFFQGAFCATGCTIVSGATAERMQLKGFGTLIIVMCGFIYPCVAYWGWSGLGFLVYTNDDGDSVSSFGPAYMDFAGSGIVHLVGGIGALVGAICVGPRLGRFDPDSTVDFSAHSIPFVVLGTFFLWFGWYGFNPGSTLSMKTTEDAYKAGLVAVNTTLAPCMGGLVVFALRAKAVFPKRLDVGGFCNGILAGLVGITAPCAFVKPWESVIIGLVAGFLYQGASMLLQKLKIDDVVDAFPVHGVCGMWGVLACGLFGDPDHGMGGNGLFYGGDQLRTQVMGIIVICAWAGGLSLLVMAPLRKLGMLRLSDEFQDQGADLMEHSPPRPYGSAEKEELGFRPNTKPGAESSKASVGKTEANSSSTEAVADQTV